MDTSAAEPTAEPSEEVDATEPYEEDESALLVGSYEPVEDGTSLTMEEIEEIDGELR